MKYNSTMLLMGLAILFCQNVYADSSTLYSEFAGKTIKVYVEDFKKSAPDTDIDAAILRQKLISGLTERKSIKFQIVDKKEDSTMMIRGDLKGFFWTDHDPVDMLIGAAATAMDAAVVEDYASMDGYFEVMDARSGRILWKGAATGNITKKPMSRQDSVPLVSEELVQSFIKSCFGKSKSARR